jgi:hypothetical protein
MKLNPLSVCLCEPPRPRLPTTTPRSPTAPLDRRAGPRAPRTSGPASARTWLARSASATGATPLAGWVKIRMATREVFLSAGPVPEGTSNAASEAILQTTVAASGAAGLAVVCRLHCSPLPSGLTAASAAAGYAMSSRGRTAPLPPIPSCRECSANLLGCSLGSPQWRRGKWRCQGLLPSPRCTVSEASAAVEGAAATAEEAAAAASSAGVMVGAAATAGVVVVVAVAAAAAAAAAVVAAVGFGALGSLWCWGPSQ